MGLDARADAINAKTPHLFVELTLYPASQSGRTAPILPGYGCPCNKFKDKSNPFWDGYPQLGNIEMFPGETREIGFVFLSGADAANEMKEAGIFFLWEGEFIGEAKIIEQSK